MKFSHSLFFCFLLSINLSIFSQSETERGIEFYKNGKFNEAIEILKNAVQTDKSNPVSYYYLGLSYENINNNKEAISSFQKSTDSTYNVFLDGLYEKIRTKEKGNPNEIFTKLSAQFEAGGLSALKLSQANFKDFKKKKPKAAFILYVHKKLNSGESICEELQSTDKTVILKTNPRPDLTKIYSKNERPDLITGEVKNPTGKKGEVVSPSFATFFIIFGEDSEIKLVVPTGIMDDFSKAYFDVIPTVKFQSAEKNGKAVSVCRILSYSRTNF